MLNKTIKAVIYARVSSDKQDREGFSIPAQIDLLHNFTNKNNMEIVKEFIEAESAKASGRVPSFTKYTEYLVLSTSKST